MADARRHVWIEYTNWRGERAWREIVPERLAFENSDWHPETQWVLYATDVAKDVERGFALASTHHWRTTPPDFVSVYAKLSSELQEAHARIAFLEARRDELQAVGNRLLFRARETERLVRGAQEIAGVIRGEITRIGENVRTALSQQHGTIASLEKALARVTDAADELIEVAELRGDSNLPHPADDPKTWTARMSDAWDEIEAARHDARAALASVPESP